MSRKLCFPLGHVRTRMFYNRQSRLERLLRLETLLPRIIITVNVEKQRLERKLTFQLPNRLIDISLLSISCLHPFQFHHHHHHSFPLLHLSLLLLLLIPYQIITVKEGTIPTARTQVHSGLSLSITMDHLMLCLPVKVSIQPRRAET